VRIDKVPRWNLRSIAQIFGRFSVRHNFEILLSSSVLLLAYAASWIGYYATLPGPFFPGGNISDRLLNWDASDYIDIAQYGYGHGPIANLSYTWFPFMPLWDKFIHAIIGIWPPQSRTAGGWTIFTDTAHTWSLALYVVGPLIAGIASIWVFYSVAQRLWGNDSSAKYATVIYAAFPGVSSFFTGLPVGFTQLFVLLAFRELLNRRFWKSSIFAGATTAIGPLNAVVVLPVIGFFLIHQWRNRKSQTLRKLWVATLAKAVGLLFLGELGLAIYALYLDLVSGHPTLFISSEHLFGGHNLHDRIVGLLSLRDFYLRFFGESISSLFFSVHSSPFANLFLPINDIAVLFVLVSSIALLRSSIDLSAIERVVVCTFGLITTFGFLWFIVSQVGIASGPRLIYIAAPSFLTLGGLWQHHKIIAVAIVTVLAISSCVQVSLLVSGYFLA